MGFLSGLVNTVKDNAEKIFTTITQSDKKVNTTASNFIAPTGVDNALAINSVLDALTNEAALKYRYGKDYQTRVAPGTRAKALLDHVNEAYIQPMTKGKFGQAGVNALTGIGEDLDVFDNVAKAALTPIINKPADNTNYADAEYALQQINQGNYNTSATGTVVQDPTGKYHTYDAKDVEILKSIVNGGRHVNPYNLTLSDRVKAAVGIGDYGRVNYNYATGSTIGNMLCEVVLSPSNWVSMGASAMEKQIAAKVTEATKAIDFSDMSDPLAKTMQKIALDISAQDDVRSGLVKEALDLYKAKTVKVHSTQSQQIMSLLAKEAGKGNQFAVNDLGTALTYVLASHGYVSHLNALDVALALNKSINNTVNQMSVSVMKSLDTLDAAANNIPLDIAGIRPAAMLVNKGYKKAKSVANWAMRQYDNGLDAYSTELLKGLTPINYSEADKLIDQITDTVKSASGTDGVGLRAVLKEAYVKPKCEADIAELTKIMSKDFKSVQDVAKAQFNINEYLTKRYGANLAELQEIAHNNLLKDATETNTRYYQYLTDVQAYFVANEAEFLRADISSQMREVRNVASGITAQLEDPGSEILNNVSKLQEAVQSSEPYSVEQIMHSFNAAINKVVIRSDALDPSQFTSIEAYHNAIDNSLFVLVDAYHKTVDDLVRSFIAKCESAKASESPKLIPAFVKSYSEIAKAFSTQMSKQTKLLYGVKQLNNFVSNVAPLADKAAVQGEVTTILAQNGVRVMSNTLVDVSEITAEDLNKVFDFDNAAITYQPKFRAIAKELRTLGDELGLVSSDIVRNKLVGLDPDRYSNLDSLIQAIDMLNDPEYFYEHYVECYGSLYESLVQFADAARHSQLTFGGSTTARALSSAIDTEEAKELTHIRERLYDLAAELKDKQIPVSEAREIAIKAEQQKLLPREHKLLETVAAQDFERRQASRAAIDFAKKGAIDTDTHNVSKSVDRILTKLEDFSPENYTYEADRIDSTKNTITLKVEQFQAFMRGLASDEANNVFQAYEANSPFRALLDNIINDSSMPQQLRNTANDLLQYAKERTANLDFVKNIQQADIPDNVKTAILQSTQKYYSAAPTDFAHGIEYYIKRITEDVDMFINSRENPVTLTLDNFYQHNKDAVNELRVKAGLPALDAVQTHTALDDSTINLVLTEQLLEQDVKDKFKIIQIDTETNGATAGYRSTMFHQIAMVGRKTPGSDELVMKQYTIGSKFVAAKDLPTASYLQKLYPETPFEQRTAKYIADHTDPNGLSERDMLIAFLNDLTAQCADHYNPMTKRYNVILAGHNIEGFDIEKLRNQIQLYKITPNEVLYLHILDKIEPPFDTLLEARKLNGFYALKNDPEAYSVFDKYLRKYADEMTQTHAAHVFSTFSAGRLRLMSDDLSAIASAVLPNAKRAKAQSNFAGLTKDQMEILQSIHDQQENIKSMLEDLRSTWQVNQKLKRTPIVLEDVFYKYGEMSDTVKERLLTLYKAQGLSEAEALARLEATNPTNLLRMIDPSDMYGWQYQVDNHKLINYFDTAKITADTTLSYSARVGLTKFSTMLDRFAERAKSFDLTEQDYQAVHDITRKMLAQEPELANLAPYFRQDKLTGNQELAFFNYCFNKLSGQDKVITVGDRKTVISAAERLSGYDIEPRLLDYLQTKGDPIKTYISKWVESDFGGTLPQYQKYSGVMQGLLNHKTDLEGTSRALGHADLISSSTQAHLEAVTPAMRMAENITQVLSRAQDKTVEEIFYNFTTSHAEQRINGIAQHFSALAPDDMAQWLASSGGFVMLPQRYIPQGLAAEYLEKNIAAEPFGSWTVVYLHKKSGYLPQSIDTGNGAMRTRFICNGQIVDRYNWAPSTDIVAHELGALGFDVAQINNTAHALQYMSDGAANASTLDLMDNSTFLGIYDALPDSIRENMIPRQVLDTNLLWEGNNFNHTVLAPYEARKTLMPYASSDYCHSLVQATVNASKAHNTALTYVQAMLSDTSRIGGSALGDAIKADPDEAIRYFGAHSEYTLCALVPAKNSHGVEVQKFEAANILQALDANAHILPTYTYDKLYKVINDNLYSSGALGAWRKFVSMYKIGYLANPGTWGRNAMDAFVKTMASTDASVSALSKEWSYAIRECADYDGIMSTLIKMKPDDMPLARWLDNKCVKDLFKSNQYNIDYDRFTMLYRYMQESAAGGEIKCLTDYTAGQRLDYLRKLNNQGFMSPDIVRQAEQSKLKDDIISAGLGGMNYTERIARMAQFNYITKRGGTFVDAMDSIAKTQFNYDNKNKFEQTVELLLPFFTFANRNLTYWMDQFEMNPRFIKELSDIVYPLWDVDQYDSDELQNNGSLQRNLMAGNIPLDGTDYFMSTNMSIMDTLNWLTDPINHTKEQVFAPVQALMNVVLQNAADGAYHQGAEAVSNWIQETFGSKPTMQQIQDKYGEWTEEYLKLTNARVSSEDTATMLKQQFFKWQLLPIIGTQIQRFENTGLYYNDNALTALGYVSGLITRPLRYDESEVLNKREKLRYRISSLIQDSKGLAQSWDDVCKKYNVNPDSSLYSLDYTTLKQLWDELSDGYKPINSRLYELLQSDDDSSWMYTRLKNALGYQGVTMKDIPTEAKLLIEQAMTDPTDISATVLPVLQDGSTMVFMWNALKREYGVSGKTFTEIPTKTLDKMYGDLAESAIVYADIINTLQNDPSSRYGYSIVKKRLGYGSLKLGQLPCSALKAIQFSLHSSQLPTFSRTSGAAGTTPRASRRRPYVKHSVSIPYEQAKAVYKNYDTWYANKMRHQIYSKQYLNNHNTSGVSNRIRAAVNNKISPIELKYRMKDMYYYFKY